MKRWLVIILVDYGYCMNGFRPNPKTKGSFSEKSWDIVEKCPGKKPLCFGHWTPNPLIFGAMSMSVAPPPGQLWHLAAILGSNPLKGSGVKLQALHLLQLIDGSTSSKRKKD